MDDDVTDVFEKGEGPFATPLMTKLREIRYDEDKAFVLATFELEDGALVHVPLANAVLVQLRVAIAAIEAERD